MRSLRAELYAMLHRGNPGDVAFYRRVCSGAEHVLELGAGYGRIASELARDGARVVALDLDPAMLGLAEAAASPAIRDRLSFVVGDMRHFSLGRRFDRIIIPYNGLCCLLDPSEVRSCLEHVRDHLAADGRVAFDVYRADPEGHDASSDDAFRDDASNDEPVVAIEHDGVVYRVVEESSWGADPQRIDVTYRFLTASGEAIEDVIRQRFLRLDEIATLAADAGLALIEIAGGFRGEPVDDEAEALVFVARHRP